MVTCTCSNTCCHHDGPFHPVASDLIHATCQQKRQNRSICESWFLSYKWLTFCITTNKVYCFYCRAANSKGLLTFSKRIDDSFIKAGFCNWKKATEKFRHHKLSQTHVEACTAYNMLQQPSVVAQLNLQLHSDQLQHRELLVKQLILLKYLMQQGLATREHIENEGNLAQLLTFATAQHDSTMEQWLSDGKYMSHDIVNEQIKLMAHHVLRDLLSDIKQAEFYSIICDET